MPRTIHRLAVGLALLAAVALLVPSAATLFVPTQPADDLGNQVHLQPAAGENGDYSYLADGELVIDVSSSNPSGDVEGVNPGTVTHLEDVFVVHYNGSEYAEVWLTHEGEGLTFTAAGQPVDSRSTAITLGPNETAAVGVLVDTTDGNAVEQVDEFTVHARAAEPEPTADDVDDDSPGDWWSGSERTTTESSDDDGEATSIAPSTTADSSGASPADAPADAPPQGSATTTGESTGGEVATVTTTQPDERSPTIALVTERAAGLTGGALAMGIVGLLAALAVVLVGRRRP
ncbi:Cell surface protein [Halanaeroarchaeum sp. HSR-CO]|uniref:DUF1102 domain-containing protein n=1 Tax=Halanaeroarchaeum sp. HSR-CO TaxID=2866382 RepID=UPI00217D4EC5|nr:DUF1102 domain-containing protein [Halanaeroarchaeum sp. HSR-CO]UWG46455.1 Cell surface protein [Halanaeroarchaeum sp. HSR-CO]